MSLVNCSEPLNKKVCDSICPSCYDFFTRMNVKNVLNVKEYFEKNGRMPYIGSCFLVGNNPGGSAQYVLDGWDVTTYNGCLQSVSRQNTLHIQIEWYHDQYQARLNPIACKSYL